MRVRHGIADIILIDRSIMIDSTRRTFIKTAAAVTAASQARILGANDRIRVAGIGTGGRGQYLLGIVSKTPGAEIVALCDVYEPHRAQARKNCARMRAKCVDYREILDDKTMDAVVIGAPNHWHVPMAVDAVGAGKDVYCEKPVTHTIEEGEPLMKAVAQSGRIVQMGMQQRSWPHFRRHAKSAGRSGRAGPGDVHSHVLVSESPAGRRRPLHRRPGQAGLEALARQRARAPVRSRCASSTGAGSGTMASGALTDLFSHWVDVVHWIMGSDTPSVATALGSKWALPLRECPDTMSAAFEYPAKFLVGYDGSLIGYREGGGMIFHGTKAMMRLHRGGYAVYPEQPRYTESPDLDVPARVGQVAARRQHLPRRELPRLHALAQRAECAGRGGHRRGAGRAPGQHRHAPEAHRDVSHLSARPARVYFEAGDGGRFSRWPRRDPSW